MYDVSDLLSLSQAKVLETVDAENVVELWQLLRQYGAHAGIHETLDTLQAHVEQTEGLRRVVTDFAFGQLA